MKIWEKTSPWRAINSTLFNNNKLMAADQMSSPPMASAFSTLLPKKTQSSNLRPRPLSQKRFTLLTQRSPSPTLLSITKTSFNSPEKVKVKDPRDTQDQSKFTLLTQWSTPTLATWEISPMFLTHLPDSELPSTIRRTPTKSLICNFSKKLQLSTHITTTHGYINSQEITSDHIPATSMMIQDFPSH